MGSISLLQWRKAYMLEFLVDNNVVDCFTFSVPPESEELQFSQRISETKTFGGSVFDDYGNDTYKITLSGSTINEDKKLIYKGKNVPQYLTGTKEIFELQKIIKNWSDGKASKGFFRKTTTDLGSNRKVMLYDLSKMSVLQIAAGTASRNYWRVFIKDLKIKRDKSKPNTYNYTLEMLGVEDTEKSNGGFLSGISDAIDNIQNVMDNIQTVMDLTQGAVTAISQIATHCANVKKAYETVQTRKDNGLSGGLIALNVGSAVDVVSRIMGGDSNSFYNTTKEALSAISTFSGLEDEEKSGTTENTSSFKVFFNTNGGTSVATQTVEYCNTVTKPTDPEKDNYSFAGWYSDSDLTTEYDFTSEVTASITLYAKWTLAKATVTYNSRNGSRVQPQLVPVGTATTPPTSPTRTGYAFDKWCTDLECTTAFDFSTLITDNITLYAAWRQTCNVVFNSNGGSDVATQVINIGELAVYPKTPTKDNYTFAYWCTDEELTNVFDFATPITQDTTLYACYVQISNTVSFESNGGTVVASQKVVIGGYATKPNDPTRTGYDFVYWCTDKALTNEFKFNTTSVNANITLYAKWTEQVLAVVFETDGGSEVETQSVKYNNKAIFPAIPTKEGYTFEMWCTKNNTTDEDSGETTESYTEFDFNTNITEDLTLYAQWFGGE